MELIAEILTVHTTHPFFIARGGRSEYQVVWVRLRDRDGVEGWGEAAPSSFYGETAASCHLAVQRFAPLLADADAWSIEAIVIIAPIVRQVVCSMGEVCAEEGGEAEKDAAHWVAAE